tara:strand:- start:4458 stop:5375 length:918 start_codon:yes stop_codon:yes gene_type:complete
MAEKHEPQGICMFAYNNQELDYIKFASLASRYAKHYMNGIKVALITDEGTENWLNETKSQQEIQSLFDYIIINNVPHEMNMRKHMDSPWTEFNAQFTNTNKHKVFELTPFKKTLLLDTDFLIMNDFYEYLFKTDIPVGMHRYAEYIGGEHPYVNEITLNEGGIQHWWSTIVYFDQSEQSKIFFDMWAHVKEHWEYYSLLYQFPKSLFRTDFCVSIAAHLMNGFTTEEFVHDYLNTPLLNMDQKDDIIGINSHDDIIFLKHNRVEQWKNILVRHTQQNLHIMNKRALDRHYFGLLENLDKAEPVNE